MLYFDYRPGILFLGIEQLVSHRPTPLLLVFNQLKQNISVFPSI